VTGVYGIYLPGGPTARFGPLYDKPTYRAQSHKRHPKGYDGGHEFAT
jgi:hypothetical protein